MNNFTPAPGAQRTVKGAGPILCLMMCGLALSLGASSAHAAIFEVTSSANSGPGTLREAITNANALPGTDGIRITGFAGVIPIDSPLPNITDDLTIDGLDDGQTLLLQSTGDFRIFNSTARNVVLANLEFENGVAANGGAINNGSGRLTLLNTQFRNNRATGDAATDGGGAIYSTGPVVVRNSSFDGNRAVGAAGSGGAILIAGSSLEVRDTTFDSNRANRAGGAIETQGNVRATIVGGVMSGNSVETVGSAPGNGGALHISGAGNVSISGTTLFANNARFQGGALWNSSSGALLVSDARLIVNNVQGSAAVGSGGGAIYSDGGTTTVRNSVFTGNRSIGTESAGGAILNKGGSLNVINSALNASVSRRVGGAIATLGGRVVLNNCTGFNNTASFFDDRGVRANGGFLHASGNANVFVSGGSFTGNDAASQGGALWNSASAVMRVDGAQFIANTAQGAASGEGGGAIYNDGGIVSVRNATLNSNRVIGAAGSGGAIYNNGGRLEFVNSQATSNTANRAGGAIESAGAANNLLIDATISGNTAGSEGAAAPGNGGAFHITGAGRAFVARGTINGNSAASEGGGLWNSAAGTLIVDGTSIQNNTASGAAADAGGGGIYSDGGALTIRNANLTANRAGNGGSGGAILNKGGRLQVVGSTLNENNADGVGGAIENVGAGGVSLVNSDFANNRAHVFGNAAPGLGDGGAFHLSGAANVFVVGGTFRGNIAFRNGGAFWIGGGGTLTMQGSTLRSNGASAINPDDTSSVDGGGGGIYNDGATINLRDATLQANDVVNKFGRGGGIFNNGGVVSVKSGSFITNSAVNAGGAIETLGGRVTASDVTFFNNSTGLNSDANGNSDGIRSGSGGAIHVAGAGNVLVVRGAIQSCSARAEGGGLWNSAAGTLVVDGTSITANTARGASVAGQDAPFVAGGGGIYNDGGALSVRNATFTGNIALGDVPGEGGGAIFNVGVASVTNCVFDGNQANRGLGNGGAILNRGSLTLSDSRLENSRVAGSGGALENMGSATLIRCILRGNSAGEEGGGLHNVGGRSAFVIASTLANNSAQRGGGVSNSSRATLALRNSTVDGNVADGIQADGGGIYNRGGTVSLDSATVTDNSAGRNGGGISNRDGTFNSLNSVVALNRADVGPDISGAFGSQGYNLIGVTPGDAVARTGDLRGTQNNPLDPKLGALADNGGPTPTRLPQLDSALINAGNTTQTTDQRGTARPQGARKEIGAVEVAGSSNATASAQSATKAAAPAPSAGNS